MRKLTEYPTLSLKERDRRWANVRKEMAARGLDCHRAVRLAVDVGLQHRQRALSLPDRRQRRVQRADLSARRASRPRSSIRRCSPTTGRARRTGSPTCGRSKGTFADSIADRLTELKMTGAKVGIDGLAGPLDPDGWTPHSLYTRLKERLPGVNLVNLEDMMEKLRVGEERRGDRGARQGREARRPDAGEMPRHGAARRQGVRSLCRHDGDDAGERRRGADAVPVGLRQAPLPASVPGADHAPARKGRHDHLRDAPEVRRLFHPRRAHLLPRQAGAALSRHLRSVPDRLPDRARPVQARRENLDRDGRGARRHHRLGLRHLRGRHPRPRPRLAGISALPPSCARAPTRAR